ncbi:MAG: hypothetical protein QXP73_01280 [Candidatus Methanomethylicaceae archaeon]
MVKGRGPHDPTGVNISRRVFLSSISGADLSAFSLLFLYLTAISSYQPEALIFLDDAPVNNAVVNFGNHTFSVDGGHFYISELKDSFQVTIDGQSFNLSLQEGCPIYLWRFYHCDLMVLDSEGNRLGNFTVYLNDSNLGQISKVVLPYGESVLKISTRYAEYSLRVNVSSPSRIRVTLPVSDLDIFLMSKDGFPLKNRALTLKFENSSEFVLTTDDRGYAKVYAVPHGLYTINVLGQERRFIHNSSIRQRFTIDVVENISVAVENAYILFPTRISVKLFSLDDRPSINSLVTLKYEGIEYRDFTDSLGEASFYLPPSLSICSDVVVSASGITKDTKICRSPAPIILVGFLIGILSFYISKRIKLKIGNKKRLEFDPNLSLKS